MDLSGGLPVDAAGNLVVTNGGPQLDTGAG